MKAVIAAATVLTAVASVSGCSAQQGYASAQAFKRNQCSKIVDAQERIRCLREADTSYDAYQKASESTRQKP